jgi:REP element-mobilizing transposase RayT
MKQVSFAFLRDYKKEFGGSLLQGKRKSARPLSTKHPIHLILKSSGNSFFNPSHRAIEKAIREHAQKYHIKIYDLALNWSHIHLLVRIASREHYKAFIRTLTAELIRLLSKTKNKNLKGLFDLRPYTRIVTWGKDFKRAFEYLTLNHLEAWGLIMRSKKKQSEKKKPPKALPKADLDGRTFSGSGLAPRLAGRSL